MRCAITLKLKISTTTSYSSFQALYVRCDEKKNISWKAFLERQTHKTSSHTPHTHKLNKKQDLIFKESNAEFY